MTPASSGSTPEARPSAGCSSAWPRRPRRRWETGRADDRTAIPPPAAHQAPRRRQRLPGHPRHRGDVAARSPSSSAALCHRHRGVGADGVIRVFGGKDGADLAMELRNADGGPAETSGNGLRCLAQAAVDAGLVAPHSFTVWTAAGVRSVDYEPGLGRLGLGLGGHGPPRARTRHEDLAGASAGSTRGPGRGAGGAARRRGQPTSRGHRPRPGHHRRGQRRDGRSTSSIPAAATSSSSPSTPTAPSASGCGSAAWG